MPLTNLLLHGVPSILKQLPIVGEQWLIQVCKLIKLRVWKNSAHSAETEPVAYKLCDLREFFDRILGVGEVPVLQCTTRAAEFCRCMRDFNVDVLHHTTWGLILSSIAKARSTPPGLRSSA